MANVIKTVLTYQLDGSTRDFNIPFEYLARKFVVVTLIGVDRKVLTINTDYRFATRTTISLTKAWGPADGYTTIELRRVTSTTDRLVDFTDGSILRAYDLNVAQIQTMHVAEEARDLTADTIGVNNDGHLDARGRRIVNLANAVDDRDAVPFGQLKAMNQNSWQARNEALQFRNEAEQFRNQTEGFKNESATHATNTNVWRNDAERFRNEAEQFKNSAASSANASANSASASHTSEVNSANSATASANSATKAEREANRAEAEADKLGNWNALAGTVEGVDASINMVSWKGAAEFGGAISTERNITLRAGKHGSFGQMVHEYDPADGQYVSNTYWAIKHPHQSGWKIPFSVKSEPNDSTTWTLHFHTKVSTSENIRANGGIRMAGGDIRKEDQSVGLWMERPAAGSWDQWRDINPAVQIDMPGTAAAVNIWRATKWGLSHSAAMTHVVWDNGRGETHLYNGDGTYVTFIDGGRIGGQSGIGNWMIQSTGSISGSAYGGGTIDDWMRNNWSHSIITVEPGAAAIWRGHGFGPGWGRVCTGVENSNADDYPDTVYWRTLRNAYHNGNQNNIY